MKAKDKLLGFGMLGFGSGFFLYVVAEDRVSAWVGIVWFIIFGLIAPLIVGDED